MNKQFILVVYDVSHNRRRTKLHNTLKDFGSPVQYSVFECLLDDEQLAKMKKAVQKVIKPRLDRVRYYPLCQRCLQGVEVTSGPEVLHETEAIVVQGRQGDSAIRRQCDKASALSQLSQLSPYPHST